MPHRYNGRNENDIPNTDNEETMLITGASDAPGAKRTDLPPLKRVNRRAQQQNQISAPSLTPPQFPHSEEPPAFPQQQVPPQFPLSSAPPPPQHPDYNENSRALFSDKKHQHEGQPRQQQTGGLQGE